MTTLTKQDIQSVTDNAKNQLLQRIVTRQDMQTQNDLLKLMLASMQQGQQLSRQSEGQRAQMTRQIAAMENRLAQMDQELKLLRGSLDKLIDTQPERILMPVQASGQTPEQRYLYNPS